MAYVMHLWVKDVEAESAEAFADGSRINSPVWKAWKLSVINLIGNTFD
jgi:hypothetical protein